MMKAYPHYKYSGINWIGDIPSHWTCTKLKYFVEISNGSDPKTNGEIPVYGTGAHPFKTCGEYKEGPTVLLGRKGTIDIPHWIEGWYWNVDTAFDTKSKNGFMLRYFWYIANCLNLDEYKSTTAVPSMTQSAYDNIRIPIPPADEQVKIAAYLDEKTEKIDALITEKQAQVEDLRKYRTSLIMEKATRGLNPKVPFHPSGSDWIGKIPEHWKSSKLKYFISIRNGSDPKTDGDIPVYGSGATCFKTCGEFKEGPTVLLGRKGTLHIPHWIEGQYWNVDTAFDTKVIKDFSLRYFYYLAINFDYGRYKSETTLPSMTQTAYENMNLPIPPLAEQHEIAVYLDKHTSKIDEAIAELETQIRDLGEYKKALITEAVTGKVDVRAWKHKEYAEYVEA